MKALEEGYVFRTIHGRVVPMRQRSPEELARIAAKYGTIGGHPVPPIVDSVCKRSRDLDTEHAYVLSTEGALLGHVVGDNNSVNIWQVGADKLKGAILTHNHPTGKGPSPGDFRVMMEEDAAANIIPTGHHTHILEPGDSGWGTVEELERSHWDAVNYETAVHGRLSAEARRRGDEVDARGYASYYDRDTPRNRQRMDYLSRRFGVPVPVLYKVIVLASHAYARFMADRLGLNYRITSEEDTDGR